MYCNVFCKLIKVYLLVSELFIHQNARCNDKKNLHVFFPAHVFHVACIHEISMCKYDMHYLYPCVTSALSILLLGR